MTSTYIPYNDIQVNVEMHVKLCKVCMHYIHVHTRTYILIKGSLDEKLPIYEQDPKSKRLDSFEKRFVRD